MESLDSQGLGIDTNKDAAYLFSLLSCCSKELGVQDLARIAASSKILKEACAAVVERDFLQLLAATVAHAAEAEAKRSAASAAAMATFVAMDSSDFDSDGE
jgi:hypothetical protein